MNEYFEYIKNNTGGLLTIVGSLLAGLFLLALYRKNKSREYRRQMFEAFQPELNRLLQQTNDDCRLILNETAYTKHGIAINNLMSHMGFIERFRLKRKWRCLAPTRVNKQNPVPYYEQYIDGGSFDKRQKIRPIVIKRIQAIISFANK